jgi:hypothetical protein
METINLFLAAGFAAPFEDGSELRDWNRPPAFCHAIGGWKVPRCASIAGSEPDADDGELEDSHDASDDPGEEPASESSVS